MQEPFPFLDCMVIWPICCSHELTFTISEIRYEQIQDKEGLSIDLVAASSVLLSGKFNIKIHTSYKDTFCVLKKENAVKSENLRVFFSCTRNQALRLHISSLND